DQSRAVMAGESSWPRALLGLAMGVGGRPPAGPEGVIRAVEVPETELKVLSRPGLPGLASTSSTPPSQMQLTSPRMPPPSSDRMRRACMAWFLLRVDGCSLAQRRHTY